MKRVGWACALALLAACGSTPAARDAETHDGALALDASLIDGPTNQDGATIDAARDAAVDAAPIDAGPIDAAQVDAAALDGAPPVDGSVNPDASLAPDGAALFDAGVPDAAPALDAAAFRDAAVPDAQIGFACTTAGSAGIDIPVAAVSGTVTLGGAPLPAANTYAIASNIYLKSRDTGALHTLAYFNYTGTGSTLYGPIFTSKLLPGSYDILYWRAWDSTTNIATSTDPSDAIPHGYRLLGSVALTAGPNTVNVDIPVAAVSGTVTLGGAPLPAANTYAIASNIYLKSRDTGALHTLAYFNYTGTGSTLYGPIFTSKLLPGSYDILYWRAWDNTTNIATSTDPSDAIPHGYRLLGSVALTAGPNTVNVDIPVAAVSGTVTLGGAPLPAANTYAIASNLYLKSRDTGALHTLAYFNYTGTGSTLYGPIFTSKLLPGSYDILYWRAWDNTTNIATSTDPSDAIPHGYRLLGSVALTAGPNTVNVDIPVAAVSGTVTLGGAPLPAANTYAIASNIYLKSRDTGALHTLAYFNYTGTGSTLYGPVFTSKLLPGSYDILYWRAWDNTTNIATSTDPSDAIPHGYRLLGSVALTAGPNTVNVDIPVAAVSGTVTLGGAPLPAANTYAIASNIYLKSRDTGALHTLAYFNYTGTGSTLYGPIFTSKLLPGSYDILYWRAWDNTTNIATSTDPSDAIPHGYRLLGSVALTAGPNTVNVDIPVAAVSGTVTLGGAPLPAANTYAIASNIYLKSRDTGALHTLAYFNYTGTGSTLYGPIFTSKLLPGSYDILYWRAWDSTTNIATSTDPSDAIPHGYRLLGSCAVP